MGFQKTSQDFKHSKGFKKNLKDIKGFHGISKDCERFQIISINEKGVR